MARKHYEDGRDMKALLQPDMHQFSGKENQDMKRQHGGELSGGQGRSSSSSSASPSLDRTSNESARWREKGPENQDIHKRDGRGRDFCETSSAGFFPSSTLNCPENQMRMGHGGGGGVNQASSSSSLNPSLSFAREDCGKEFPKNQGPMTQAGYPSSSFSSSDSTSNQQRKCEEKGSENQRMKTQHGSGGDFGFTSSSIPPSSPSPQSASTESVGQGRKSPEKQMKTQHAAGSACSGQAESFHTPPSSPSDPRLKSERQAEENREEFKFQTDENWFGEEKVSSCCTDADLKRIEQCKDDLGPLKPSKKHTVLIDSDSFNKDRRIVPFSGKHVWDPHSVKLPCLQVQSQGALGHDSRWKQIKRQLSNLASKQTAGVRDVAEAILHFNPKYKGQWSFESLSTFVRCLPKTDTHYGHGLFPKIAALAVKLPDEVKTAIPLLRSGHVKAITLSQAQIACLLANAFFCTFPHRNTSRPNAEYHNYPSINFSSLFGNRLERKNEKLRAIMHYFNIVTDKKTNLSGLVTFERRLLRGADVPQWKSCTEKINKLYVTSEGHIEREGSGLLQVDFANSWVGGGVLGSGLVQEEILFLINPELIVSRLFTERLQDDECLVITGSQQFSLYSGYSDSFEWLGPHEDRLQRDEWRRLKREIVAIDALHYRNRRDQYNMSRITRELNKAYCGFKGRLNHDKPDIATGKWGCGAFNGDPQLKAVIQLMAAAKAGRGLAFFTFQDKQLEHDLRRTHHLLVTSGITVGKLHVLLQDYCAKLQKLGVHMELFYFLQQTLRSERSQL